MTEREITSRPEPGIETACGGKISDASQYPGATYRGKRIYFCSQACLEAFRLNPDPFMAGQIEHPA